MYITKIKQQLHDFIDSAEDKKLKTIYTLLEGDILDHYDLSDDQKKELDKRYNDFQLGIGKNYTLREMITMSSEFLNNEKSQ